MNYADSFLIQCKENYFKKITPANKNSRGTKEYEHLVLIAKDWFKKGILSEFAGFFLEGQYFVALWAAHLIVEYSNQDSFKKEAIEVIKDYSGNPLAPKVADEELQWLKDNYFLYKNYFN